MLSVEIKALERQCVSAPSVGSQEEDDELSMLPAGGRKWGGIRPSNLPKETELPVAKL